MQEAQGHGLLGLRTGEEALGGGVLGCLPQQLGASMDLPRSHVALAVGLQAVLAGPGLPSLMFSALSALSK